MPGGICVCGCVRLIEEGLELLGCGFLVVGCVAEGGPEGGEVCVGLSVCGLCMWMNEEISVVI